MRNWSISKIRELLSKYYGFEEKDIEIESINRSKSDKPGKVRIYITLVAPEDIPILEEKKEKHEEPH